MHYNSVIYVTIVHIQYTYIHSYKLKRQNIEILIQGVKKVLIILLPYLREKTHNSAIESLIFSCIEWLNITGTHIGRSLKLSNKANHTRRKS